MDKSLKIRLAAAGGLVLIAGLMAYDWHDLIHNGQYHVKLSGAGPIVVLGCLLLLAVPDMAGPPQPGDTRYKFIAIALVALGLALGGLNVYLLDHYHPPRPLDKVPTFTPAVDPRPSVPALPAQRPPIVIPAVPQPPK